MDDISKLIAEGQCCGCSKIFAFNPFTVPSIFIDPVTGKSPDLLPEAEQAAAMQRAEKEPVCPDCVEKANLIREKNNLRLLGPRFDDDGGS